MIVEQISDISPVGTMAFLYEEDNLLVRVRNGWQYVSVSTALLKDTRRPRPT